MFLQWARLLDEKIFVSINSGLASKSFDVFFPAITDLHTMPWFFVVLITISLALLWSKYRRASFIILLALLVCVLCTDFIGTQFFKNQFQRPRPAATENLKVILRTHASGYSFTSNHAANTFSFATFMYAFNPIAGIGFAVIAALVSLSRIYNGVHFPFDVIVGACLGIAIGYVFSYFTKRVLQKSFNLENATEGKTNGVEK